MNRPLIAGFVIGYVAGIVLCLLAVCLCKWLTGRWL